MTPTAESYTDRTQCPDAATETPLKQQSQLQLLPHELLQEILQRMQSCHWPTARLVNKQFDASLAPLIKTITIRQWPTGSSSKMCVSASSSLKQVRQLSAVIDDPSHLQHLLQLLAQLPHVQQLSLRGLKPLAGLSQLLFSPQAALRTQQRLGGAFPAAAAADALARLTRLDLPDSSSSSLPANLQLPGLTSMTLFSVDSIQDLAGFAPNLQCLECFSVTLTPAKQPQAQQQAAGTSGVGDSARAAPAALLSCKTLSASLLISSSAKAAAACLAAAVPALQQLVVLPQLQYTGPSDVQQECDEITLSGLQAVLPGLQLVTQP